MRVYELARELEVESKDVLARAEELDIEVKTASSGLSDEEADLLRLAFSPDDAADVGVDEGPDEPDEEKLVAVEHEALAEEAKTEKSGIETTKAKEAPEVEDEVELVDEAAGDVEIVSVADGASVAEFADAIGQPAGEVVKELLNRGIPAGAGQTMPCLLYTSPSPRDS